MAGKRVRAMVLKGKSVVVTGAGRGLGRAYARAAADAGASVVVNDVDVVHAQAVVDEITQSGGAAVASDHDVSDPVEAGQLVARCEGAFGAIDGLVNNAGLFHVGPAWDEEPARVRRLIEVNVLGSMFCGNEAIRRMRTRNSGSIINVTSGAHLGIPGMSTYGASKGAVASMTWGWALDLADLAIRVNAISPIARTRMTEASGTSGGSQPEPEMIAPLVVYLLSDEAKDVTGQVLRLDGERLSALRPARFAEPISSAEEWTWSRIADALQTGSFKSEPIGLAGGQGVAERPSDPDRGRR